MMSVSSRLRRKSKELSPWSNIRKWMLDADIVEAVIQLPMDEFFNTGIYTYLWVFNKNKPPERKEYDVAFLCWPTDERRRIERQVRDICYKHGYSYLTGTWDNPYEYAHHVGRAKVVVHYAHVKRARSWRVFDVMACQGALLTSVLPIVDGDGIEPGKHYWEYTNDLEEQLVGLVSTGCWERIAKTGHEHVMAHHTWKTRATELRKTLNEVVGL